MARHEIERWTHNSFSVSLKAFPTLRRTLQSLTKKHRVTLAVCDHVELQGTYWDEGSKSEYYRLYPEGGRSPSHLAAPASPPEFGGSVAPTVNVTPECPVARGGVFRGKRGFVTVFAHPDGLARLGLPCLAELQQAPKEEH